MGPYARVLRTPGVLLPLLASFVGALPIGMLGLAVLLLAREATGSLGTAGAVAGALTAGNAAGVALQGQLIDRRGQPRVLVPAALSCAGSLVLLLVAAAHGGPPALLGLLALFAGVTIPATTSSMRVLWPLLLRDDGMRTAAYAVGAVAFTAALFAGPLVVSGLLVLSGTAGPVLAAAALAAGAGLLFARTPASRRWTPAAPRDGWRPRGLATSGMRTLVVAALMAGSASGLLGVGVPAVAIAHRAPALAGVLFALVAVGDLAGGLLYGSRPWPLAPPARLPALQAGHALVMAGLALDGDARWLAAAMLLVGLLTAPMSITASALLDSVAARGALTEAYTLLVAAGLVGSSAGYAAGGTLAHAAGGGAVFAAAACAMTCASAWNLARRHTLRGPVG